MSIDIVRMMPDDWEKLRDIRLKALQSDPGVFGSNYQKESAYDETVWRSWLTNPKTAIFMIVQDGVGVGMTGVAVNHEDPTGRSAMMWGSWLEKHIRGQGVSEMMYKARINWAKNEEGLEKIVISHRESNLASKFANQKHGFVYTHTEPKVWPDGKEENSVFYSLNLR